jgi:hypothetical protein
MVMISINSTGLVTQWIQNYKIWRDSQKFYNNREHLEIAHSDIGVSCYHYTNVDQINSDPSSVIVIDCLTEGIHSSIYFKKYNRNKHYLIFSNGWWDTDLFELPISYDLVHYHFFLFEMADTYLSPSRFCFYLDKHYKFEEHKPCIFISTIGNVRNERDILIEELQRTLTYKNYILRYSGQDLGQACTSDVIELQRGMFDPYTCILPEYYHNLSQTLPIDIYNQGRFNLVVETDLDLQNEFLLTEKTIKALITGIPFVVAATPYFLKHLQSIGFTTYGSLWNESYDSITDFRLRMKNISNLCEQLNKFDWNTNYAKLLHIQLLNRNNFFNLSKIVHQQFTNTEVIFKKVFCES